jgi:COMPASS component SWD3
VFSLKFKADDPNVLLSGGWDNTVQMWDVRAGHSVRSIYGPHICGDALDVNAQGHILTGSCRPDKALQLWDMGTGKLMKDIFWAAGSMGSEAVQARSHRHGVLLVSVLASMRGLL